MLDHNRFAALRMSNIFPGDCLEANRYYIEVDRNGGFDEEYMGGMWHEELIDGVQLFFPKRAGDKLGIIELWGAGCVQGAAAQCRPDPLPSLLVPEWTVNADTVLTVLDLPIRMGSDEAAVQSLASGRVSRFGYPDAWYDRIPELGRGTVASLTFAHLQPDLYHMRAVVHATAGLLSFAVRRPDLIRINEFEKGTYDSCVGGLFDVHRG